jgi:hypothetical protein
MKLIMMLVLSLPACAQSLFSDVKASPAEHSCTIHWMTVVPTIGYVEYGLTEQNYAKQTPPSRTYSTSNKATASGLTAATTYHFRILAFGSSKVWVESNDYTCTTTRAVQHSVKLNWQSSPSREVTGYHVYRSTIPGGYYAFLASPAGLTYTDDTVQSGLTYYYVISAINKAGEQSKYSNQVKVVIP